MESVGEGSYKRRCSYDYTSEAIPTDIESNFEKSSTGIIRPCAARFSRCFFTHILSQLSKLICLKSSILCLDYHRALPNSWWPLSAQKRLHQGWRPLDRETHLFRAHIFGGTPALLEVIVDLAIPAAMRCSQR